MVVRARWGVNHPDRSLSSRVTSSRELKNAISGAYTAGRTGFLYRDDVTAINGSSISGGGIGA